eukprot:10104708-Alexandrium_andersonii.AAC.1
MSSAPTWEARPSLPAALCPLASDERFSTRSRSPSGSGPRTRQGVSGAPGLLASAPPVSRWGLQHCYR